MMGEGAVEGLKHSEILTAGFHPIVQRSLPMSLEISYDQGCYFVVDRLLLIWWF